MSFRLKAAMSSVSVGTTDFIGTGLFGFSITNSKVKGCRRVRINFSLDPQGLNSKEL